MRKRLPRADRGATSFKIRQCLASRAAVMKSAGGRERVWTETKVANFSFIYFLLLCALLRRSLLPTHFRLSFLATSYPRRPLSLLAVLCPWCPLVNGSWRGQVGAKQE